MNRIIIALAAILSWALLSVVSRVLLVKFGFDPWMFSFLQLVSGGITLLALGYRGGRVRHSFARVSTWGLGALRVLSAALYFAVLASISVLEAGTLGAINLPVVAIMVFALNRTHPRGLAWAGHLIILGAVALVAARLEPDIRTSVLALMALNAVCLGAMNLIAEHHPENKSASLSGRAWFSGVVLSITAAVFLGARLVQGGELLGALGWPLLASSLIVGVCLRAPSMFLTFWAINAVGAQGYTAAIALLPLFGMGFEQAAIALGVLDSSRFQMPMLYLALLALAGTLLVWGANRPLRRTA